MTSTTFSIITASFGLILTVLNIVDRVSIMHKQAKEPQMELEMRVANLETNMSKVKEYLGNDNQRIQDIEEGNRVVLKSLNALLGHGIDGNNDEEMRKAREELNIYLINK